MQTPLTTLLDIRHPVLLAPMGRIAGGALARAVTEAGGLGLIDELVPAGVIVKRLVAEAEALLAPGPPAPD